MNLLELQTSLQKQARMVVERVTRRDDPLTAQIANLADLADTDFTRLVARAFREEAPPNWTHYGFGRDDVLREVTRRQEHNRYSFLTGASRVSVEEAAEQVAQWEARAGDARGLQFKSSRTPGDFCIVAPDPEAIGWRMTRFDGHGPAGHHCFPDRNTALQAVSGAWVKGMGPPFASQGEWLLDNWESPRRACPSEPPVEELLPEECSLQPVL